MERTIAGIEGGLRAELHSGAEIYVSLRGEVMADEVFGHTSAGAPLTRDAPLHWLSAGKPLAAVALAQLRERGWLDFDDRVVRYIPEFAPHGKDLITIRHLLTHTGGFRTVLGDWESQPWDRIIASICAARIEPHWVVGQTAGYHPFTSWYVLAEIIRRVDGRPYDLYVREQIFQPLGMKHCSFGEGRLSPGSSAQGPARELGSFYEMLRDGGREVLRPQGVTLLTSPQRVGLYDKTFRHTIDFGLGFVLQSNKYGVDTVPYNYGPYASQSTFGHGGARCCTGYCDPAHGLVVAALFAGRASEIEHHLRMAELNRAIYEDLHLVNGK